MVGAGEPGGHRSSSPFPSAAPARTRPAVLPSFSAPRLLPPSPSAILACCSCAAAVLHCFCRTARTNTTCSLLRTARSVSARLLRSGRQEEVEVPANCDVTLSPYSHSQGRKNVRCAPELSREVDILLRPCFAVRRSGRRKWRSVCDPVTPRHQRNYMLRRVI